MTFVGATFVDGESIRLDKDDDEEVRDRIRRREQDDKDALTFVVAAGPPGFKQATTSAGSQVLTIAYDKALERPTSTRRTTSSR